MLTSLVCITLCCSVLKSIAHNEGSQKEGFDSSGSILYTEQGTYQQDVHFYEMNSLKEIQNVISDYECNAYNLTVDCSGLNIKKINSSWFRNSTEIILLNNNAIQKLDNSTFVNLYHLKHLDLSNNMISHIELLAFEGLINLKSLILRYNEITFEQISPFIFKPLYNLEHLDLIQKLTTQKSDAPVLMLQPLTQLRNLSISTVRYVLYFEPEFLNFTSLEALEITGSTRNITDSSFENVKGLKELFLRDMVSMSFMDDHVFVPLKTLTRLRFNTFVIDLQHVLSLLWPFRGRNMSEMFFQGVTTSRLLPNPIKNGFLTQRDFVHLTHVCVESVSLIFGNIYYITANAFINRTTWNSCLRHVAISGNALVGSSAALFPLGLLANLETVVINNALRPCLSFSPFPSVIVNENCALEPTISDNLSLSDDISFRTIIRGRDSYKLQEESYTMTTELFYIVKENIYLELSNHLLSLNLQRLFANFAFSWNIVILGAKKLQYIDISDSGFTTFVGSVQGLSTLRTAILSGNDVSILSESFFYAFYGLENLALSKCQLDKNLFATRSDRIFKNNTKLKELDISDNYLNGLSKGTFSKNSELIYLSLSGNQFKEIPFDLNFTQNLKILNISNNVITSLTAEVTAAIDFLNSKNKGFQLMLNGNILSCGCHDLSFLQWLNSTLVSLDNNRNYTCMSKDGERTNTLTFSDLESLWRQCWGEFFFYIAMIVLCLYIIGVVLMFLVLKNKNFFVSFFLHIVGNFKLHARSDYKTDVYIGYSDEDYRFPCKDLRQHLEKDLKLSTYLIDRDLLASLDKASGIVNAINSCWRVLLVCSKSFLKDEDWSMFTMRSAMYAQSPANPARIVLMVHTSCLSLLPTELLSVVNDENILVVSEWKINYILSEKLRTRLVA
ncbi:TLR cluster1 member 23 [Biomphalaria glabrata]|nr:leucine-rich repeat receptor-like protein CLAVATA2 [Biomphalaria glabrata]